ncbi:MAG: hypothetical protein HQL01_12285 [Nitrospirae bacterium]|nr:hypothetical protein [Nitrospirota bacterium]
MNPTQGRLAASDIVIIAAIFIAGVKLTYGLERFLDIGLYDESVYLYKGVMLGSLGVSAPDGGPLYRIWYWFLSLFVKDNIKLYYLNYRIMAIVPTILFYILMRTYRTPIAVSLGVTFFYLISIGNLSVWPKPSHFAIAMAVALFTIKKHIASESRSALFLAGGTLLMSYARPEFFLSYVLFLGFYIVYIISERRVLAWRKELAALICLVLVSLVLLCSLGVPVSGTNRSWMAFGQHFSLNVSHWEKTDVNVWTNWEAIVAKPFGNAHSIAGALMNNPSAFIKHVAYNIIELKSTFFGVFFMHFNILLPTRTGAKFIMEGYLLAALLAWFSVYYRKRLLKNFRDNFSKDSKTMMLFSSFLCLPPLVSLVVIYPRYHYALIVGVFAAFVAAVALSARDSVALQKNTVISYAVLFILLTPYSGPNPYFSYSSKGPLQNVETIKFIGTLNISGTVNMLEAEGGFAYYLGRNYNWITEWGKSVGFYQFLKDNGINMIVLSDTLNNDSRFAGDSQWLEFLSNVQNFGFVKVGINGTQRQLLVHETLMRQH